jgi:predicted nucleotidyltransferase
MSLLQAGLQKVVEKLLSEVHAVYGERLVSLAIFGSVGRGTPAFDSDIDFLIVARGLPMGRMKRIREFDRVEERLAPLIHSLHKEGIHTSLSPIIKNPEEAGKGSPLFLDMVEDAEILFDSEGFFAGVLARLNERLKALGSRRVRLGNAWYWVLKPDIKAGEVFEI